MLSGQHWTTRSAVSASGGLREPPGQLAVAGGDSGRRDAARPPATATSMAGQSVVTAVDTTHCAPSVHPVSAAHGVESFWQALDRRTSRTESLNWPFGKRSLAVSAASGPRMKMSASPFLSPGTKLEAQLSRVTELPLGVIWGK